MLAQSRKTLNCAEKSAMPLYDSILRKEYQAAKAVFAKMILPFLRARTEFLPILPNCDCVFAMPICQHFGLLKILFPSKQRYAAPLRSFYVCTSEHRSNDLPPVYHKNTIPTNHKINNASYGNFIP